MRLFLYGDKLYFAGVQDFSAVTLGFWVFTAEDTWYIFLHLYPRALQQIPPSKGYRHLSPTYYG